jgi:hypothetical protein
MADLEPDLDDPRYAQHAWARFRRIMAWMSLFGVACGLVSVALLWWWIGEMPLVMALGTFFGVALSIIVAAALMGLMFLSSGSGHDARIEDPSRDERFD